MHAASRGLTKSKQLGALNEVRTTATRSLERGLLAHKTIAKQIQVSLARSVMNTAIGQHVSTGYEDFERNHGTSSDKDESNSSFGRDNNMQIYNYRSQAEETIQRYGNGNRDDRNENNTLQFEIRDGKRYPKHPAPPHNTSDFPVDHRGCYYCGG